MKIIIFVGDGTWKKITTQGDVPPPRSGQSMCQFGKYIFLFGGIDFENEAIYNDLYMLNIGSNLSPRLIVLETWNWKYVGEAGEEIPARNSHILCAININDLPYLVLFGGASPELGPLGDTFYAPLPQDGVPGQFLPHFVLTFVDEAVQPIASTDNTTEFFVTWKRLEGLSPCPREMFSASVLHISPQDSALIISGGKTIDSILSDVWILRGTNVSSSKISSDGSDESSSEVSLQWQQLVSLELPHPRCAHASVILPLSQPSQEIQDESNIALSSLVLFGGFTGQGISDDIIQHDICLSDSPTSSWQPIISSQTIPGRFGHVICVPPPWMRAKKQAKSATGLETSGRNILLYGGVDAEQDYNDLWLFSL